MDNTLLAQEIISDYGRSCDKPRCTLKLDIKKAFDSVNWNFVINILKHMHFPLPYICWVHESISTPVFSICFNGKLEGFINGAKGIR